MHFSVVRVGVTFFRITVTFDKKIYGNVDAVFTYRAVLDVLMHHYASARADGPGGVFY